MIKAYIDFWKRAFDFSGRSTRPDYWWFFLANIIVYGILVVVFVFVPLFIDAANDPAILNNSAELRKMFLTFSWPIVIFDWIIRIPRLSLQFRRLRDAGFHPAWGLLSCLDLVRNLAFFSLIGSIILLIMSCQPTKPAPETQFDKVE